MHRVQCLDCRQVLSGRRHSYTEYVYCESCARYKFRRLQAQIDTLEAAAHKASQQEKERRLAFQKAEFLSTWISHDPNFPPFSDVALLPADGSAVHAHRAILAGKSPAFEAMFSNLSVHGGTKDETNISINIQDMSHEVLQAFIRFFYTATIDPEIMEKHSRTLYGAAEKYGVKFLKEQCEDWITNNVSDQNAISNLELAKQFDSEVVKDAVLHTASLHIDKIPSYAEYQTYVEKDPGLLLELYEGTLKMMSRKRSRKDSMGEYGASTPSRLSEYGDSSGNDAHSVA